MKSLKLIQYCVQGKAKHGHTQEMNGDRPYIFTDELLVISRLLEEKLTQKSTDFKLSLRYFHYINISNAF